MDWSTRRNSSRPWDLDSKRAPVPTLACAQMKRRPVQYGSRKHPNLRHIHATGESVRQEKQTTQLNVESHSLRKPEIPAVVTLDTGLDFEGWFFRLAKEFPYARQRAAGCRGARFDGFIRAVEVI